MIDANLAEIAQIPISHVDKVSDLGDHIRHNKSGMIIRSGNMFTWRSYGYVKVDLHLIIILCTKV